MPVSVNEKVVAAVIWNDKAEAPLGVDQFDDSCDSHLHCSGVC